MFKFAMKRIVLVAVVMLAGVSALAQEEIIDVNVWTGVDGVKYYVCPVMKGEGRVDEVKAFSIIGNKRYYHCCAPCQAPFRKDPDKWLKDFVMPGNLHDVDDQGRKRFHDPVNCREGIVKEKTLNLIYNGKRYFFASEKTLAEFEAAPVQYIEKAHE